MINIVYHNCCGVDVHKKSFTATIVISDNSGASSYYQKTFSTFNHDISNFASWLNSYGCRHVCMESTGKYWIPIFNYLESDFFVCLAHPKYTKSIKGKKTDKRDSKWIADLFKTDFVKSSVILPKPFRELREITRYRAKLVHSRTAEKNRIQNSLTVSNITLPNVFSDPFSKSARDILELILKDPDRKLEARDIKPLVRKNTKASLNAILDSVRQHRLEPDQTKKIKVAFRHLDSIQESIQELELEIMVRIAPYREFVDLLSTMPGITPLSASIILAEIGVDMSIFQSSKHLASWAGLVPANNESAGKKKSTRISKSGSHLKPLLIQCALANIASKNSYFGKKYLNIKKRRGHKKAIVAIARMMLVSIFNMISKKETFNPSDYEEFMNPKPQLKPVIRLNDDLVFKYLEENGYDISSVIKLKNSS